MIQQLEIPFEYQETPKKEVTPEDKIYISEIKQKNFRHLHFLSCSQDTLMQALCQDKELKEKDEDYYKAIRKYYRTTLCHEGKFITLQNTFKISSERIAKLRIRHEKQQRKKEEQEKREQTEAEEKKERIRQQINNNVEAEVQLEKWLDIHTLKGIEDLSTYRIFEHIFGCKGDSRSEKYFSKERYFSQKKIKNIAQKLLYEQAIEKRGNYKVWENEGAVGERKRFLEEDKKEYIKTMLKENTTEERQSEEEKREKNDEQSKWDDDLPF